MYEKPFKLHVLDLISFLDQINIYSLNPVFPLFASVAENYQLVFPSLSKKKLESLLHSKSIASINIVCNLIYKNMFLISSQLLNIFTVVSISRPSQQVQNCTVVGVFHAWL